MNRKNSIVFFVARALICASFCLNAHAQTSTQPQQDGLTARYQKDLSECEAQQATQDLAACRLEARNALAEAKRNLLSESSANLFETNQLKRCRVFKGDDREACEARVRNEGSSSGSVLSGGLLREVVRPVAPSPAR
jgi:curli biogenesis system outer membrane secretion channel CsgG